jgi:hypothetical protein
LLLLIVDGRKRKQEHFDRMPHMKQQPSRAKVFQKLFGGLLGSGSSENASLGVDGPRGKEITEESNPSPFRKKSNAFLVVPPDAPSLC